MKTLKDLFQRLLGLKTKPADEIYHNDIDSRIKAMFDRISKRPKLVILSDRPGHYWVKFSDMVKDHEKKFVIKRPYD